MQIRNRKMLGAGAALLMIPAGLAASAGAADAGVTSGAWWPAVGSTVLTSGQVINVGGTLSLTATFNGIPGTQINCTLFSNAIPERVAKFFDLMMEMGLDGITISPGYAYERAPDQDSFLNRTRTKQLFRDIFARGGLLEIPLLLRSGKTRRTRWRSKSGPGGTFAFGADVTDEVGKRAQQEQQLRLEAAGTLVAGLAHAVRNPLNGVGLHLALAFPGVLGMRLIAQVERRVHVDRERLEAAAARHLERRLHPTHEVELVLVLMDVEGERHRRDDFVHVVLAVERLGLVYPLEVLVCRADPGEIQREHEPLKIPRNGLLSERENCSRLPLPPSRWPRAWGCIAARTGARRSDRSFRR